MVDRLRAYTVFLVICIALALNFWFGIYTAEASTVAMQTADDESRTTHQTFPEDTRLTNSCIEAGESKSHCLCVTSIYKHQLSARDYKAAVALYATDKNTQPKTLKANHNTLNFVDYSSAEINQINTKRRELLKESAFKKRCEDANKYFSSN